MGQEVGSPVEETRDRFQGLNFLRLDLLRALFAVRGDLPPAILGQNTPGQPSRDQHTASPVLNEVNLTRFVE